MKLNRMLWTFGNHESLLMYRRIGRRSTGGVQGSAEWMESWHRRFDSEETFARMEEIGANTTGYGLLYAATKTSR